MKYWSSNNFPYSILVQQGDSTPYPLLRNENGTEKIYSPSPLHGRSFVVGQHNDGRFIISKGNGLCYSQHTFLYTPDMPSDVWGLLLKEDALRDYYCCQDVRSLGIKTNQMECVLELDYPIHIDKTGVDLKPCLLQYSVESPYRICDAPFMEKEQIEKEVSKWQRFNSSSWQQNHIIAAEVLIKNLRIMHDHEVLHNAIHEQNYTWALELLDFELCRTPQHPYDKADYERHVCSLYDREVIQTYVIINYIASVLKEEINFKLIDDIFDKYHFSLKKFNINH
jgi:hypothetical protein